MVSATSTFTSATNRGPITSTFTPAPSCLSTYSLDQEGTLMLGYFLSGGTSCYPSTSAILTASPNGWESYYYSPAICPSGWKTAVQLGGILNAPSLDNGTYAYLCCPLDFKAQQDSYDCITNLTSGQTITSAPFSGTSLGKAVTTTVGSSGSIAYAAGIPIIWATTDLVILELLGSTTLSSSFTTSASLVTVTEAPSTVGGSTIATIAISTAEAAGGTTTSGSANSSTSSSHGLTGGTKAGIAIGVIALAVFIALWIFLCGKGRYRSIFPHSNDSTSSSNQPGPHELITNSNAHELPGLTDRPYELHGAEAEREKHLASQEIVNNIETLTAEIGAPGVEKFLQKRHEVKSTELEATPSPLSATTSQSPVSPSPITQQHFPIPQSPTTPQTPISPTTIPALDTSTHPPSNPNPNESEEEAQLAILTQRMERIRADKERLEQIQRLTELEEQTKAEIMAAAAKRDARASGQGHLSPVI